MKTTHAKRKDTLRVLSEAVNHSGPACFTWPFFLSSVGYARMMMHGKLTLVHRLVCEQVHGPAPSSKHEAAHSCGKGHEGCISGAHLSWKTRAENAADMIAHGRSQRGKRHYAVRLDEEKVRFIRCNADRLSVKDMAQMFGVSHGVVYHVIKGNSWAWVDAFAAERGVTFEEQAA